MKAVCYIIISEISEAEKTKFNKITVMLEAL